MQLLPILRKSPFARLLLFYTLGIFSANAFVRHEVMFQLLAWGIAITFMALFISVRFLISYRTMWLNGLLAGLTLYFLGMMNMGNQICTGKLLANKEGRTETCLLIIEDQPEIRESTYKAIARVTGIRDTVCWEKVNFKVLLYFQKDSLAAALHSGSGIIARLRFQSVPFPGNPGEFDYRKYLANRGIFLQGYLHSHAWLPAGCGKKMVLKTTAYRMRDVLLKKLGNLHLDRSEYGLLSALTLGYKNDLDTHTKHIFSQAGVMHVMALSGFNVSILAVLLGFVLGIFDGSRPGRIAKTVIVILVLWFFALLTGLSSSVTRATVMISFVMAGKVLNRQINTYNILFASAFVLLAFTPGMLNDVSFQLSFAAVLGIIGIQPVLYRLMIFRNKPADKIWQLFTVSCAAQFSTMPFTLYYFHQFPVYFWLTNLYVVPLVSLIICVAIAYLLLGFITPLGVAIGKILAVILKGLVFSVGIIEELPFSLLDNIYINPLQAVLLASVVLLLCLFLVTRKTQLLPATLAIIILFQLLQVYHRTRIIRQQVFMVGNVRGASVIQMIKGRYCMMLTGSSSDLSEADMKRIFRNFWISRGTDFSYPLPEPSDTGVQQIVPLDYHRYIYPWLGNNVFFEFAGKRVIFLQDDHIYDLISGSRLQIDVTVISGKLNPDLTGLTRVIDTGLLVLDSSVKMVQADRWKKMCLPGNIACWNVYERGAFLIDANR